MAPSHKTSPKTTHRGPVLVVGGTGMLGGKVVDALLERGAKVRALVREGTDPAALAAKGVEVVRGDLLDPPSLDRALAGAAAVVTSAIGYSHRKRGDSLKKVDGQGNRNLIDAAQRAGTGRFVFTSVLACDQAPDVPHFWMKKLAEDHLRESGVPFVSLRPGMFLDPKWMARGLRKGKMMTLGSAKIPWSVIHPDDVARDLALAVEDPQAVGKCIDLGCDRPVSTEELAAVFAQHLGKPIKVGKSRGMMAVGRIAGKVVPMVGDMMSMFDFFQTGKYVADTALQEELFGAVPTVEDSARRMLKDAGLLPAQ